MTSLLHGKGRKSSALSVSKKDLQLPHIKCALLLAACYCLRSSRLLVSGAARHGERAHSERRIA
jgi:hypothetical protein